MTIHIKLKLSKQHCSRLVKLLLNQVYQMAGWVLMSDLNPENSLLTPLPGLKLLYGMGKQYSYISQKSYMRK